MSAVTWWEGLFYVCALLFLILEFIWLNSDPP